MLVLSFDAHLQLRNILSTKEVRQPNVSNTGKTLVVADDDADRGAANERKKSLYSFIAGGLAGSISSTITCPVEVVKTQLQSSAVAGGSNFFQIASNILKHEGPAGFFRGLPPTLVGIIPSRASYFWAYGAAKRGLAPRLGDSTPTHFLAAIAAGVTGNTITNPIWVLKTRMQLLAGEASKQTGAYQSGYRTAIQAVLKEEGWRGFYKGLSASYWGCSEGCIQFVAYERLKGALRTAHNREREAAGLPPTETLPPLQYVLGAGAAKLVASALTYPHEVARTRMREAAVDGVTKYKGMWQSLGLIAKEEGRAGLYAGMGTHLARVVPNTAIMFLSFELISKALDRKFGVGEEEEEEVLLLSEQKAKLVNQKQK